MAYLAVRGSGAVNGVSRLHGKVSRRIFHSSLSALAGERSAHRTRYQRSPHVELGFGRVRRSVDEALRKGPLAGNDGNPGTGHSRRFRREALATVALPPPSRSLNTSANGLSGQLEASGASPEEVDGAKHIFDANALTLGFARRFATYKRPNLLLHDPERLLRILTNPQRPVQLIIAGKAHPADQAGQALIQEWTHFIRRPEARKHAVFLSDYDMHSDRATGAGGGCLDQHATATLGGLAERAA